MISVNAHLCRKRPGRHHCQGTPRSLGPLSPISLRPGGESKCLSLKEISAPCGEGMDAGHMMSGDTNRVCECCLGDDNWLWSPPPLFLKGNFLLLFKRWIVHAHQSLGTPGAEPVKEGRALCRAGAGSAPPHPPPPPLMLKTVSSCLSPCAEYLT